MSKLTIPHSLSQLKTLLGRLTTTQRTSLWVLLATGALAALYLVYSLLFLGQVYPRVMIGSEKFAGLTNQEVTDKLEALSARLETQPIELTSNGTSTRISAKEVDWQLDVSATAERIYRVGRSDNAWQSFFAQLKAPFLQEQISPVVSYDQQSLQAFVDLTAQTVDQPAANASATFTNDQLTFTKEKDGLVIDRQKLTNTIVDHWQKFQGATIELERQLDLPSVVLGDESAVRSVVDELSKRQMTLSYFSTKKTLTKREIRSLIGFVGANSDTAKSQPLTAQFTEDRAKAFLEELAAKVNQPAQEPKLVVKNGILSIAQNSKEGQVINVAQSSSRLLSAITGEETHPTVELVIDAQSPSINEANLSALGIKERIGFGETNFVGSPTNRKLNIANGVLILSSSLVKPGEEFSTVKTLGAVDNTTGFLPELVIKDNRTTPEFGGGLCQVSTTLFRAVMNAGLKVTERQNHSYRVSYYEPPVGLDATIYLPRPDFKFINDTPGSILVQGQVVGTKVIFELWGTSDGRTSTVSEPRIISTTPVGEPIYADTDTLFKGETKQIEKPHDGAVTTATYTVTRNGQVINKQTFKSVYKAWPARFLVGTKEPPPPAEPTPPPA